MTHESFGTTALWLHDELHGFDFVVVSARANFAVVHVCDNLFVELELSVVMVVGHAMSLLLVVV